MGCSAMLRSLRIVPPFVCLLLAGVPAFAAVDGRPCPAEPSDINMTYGDMVTNCKIDVIGDTDVVRFVGSAGEVIRIRVVAVAGGGTPCITVFDPQGRGLGLNGHTCFGSSLYVIGALTLSGSHTILIGERDTDAAMNYNIVLDRLSQPYVTAMRLPFGVNLTEDLDPVGDLDLFTFSVSAGDSISISVTATAGAGTPCINLYDSAGRGVGMSGHTCFGGTVSPTAHLPNGGIYVLDVGERDDDSTMTYLVNVQCVGRCAALPLPSATVTLTGCTACRVGNIFSARLQLQNLPQHLGELKFGFYLPDTTTLSVGDSHIELPANFTFDGETVRGTILQTHQQGAWRLCARVLELRLGELVAESCQAFTVGP